MGVTVTISSAARQRIEAHAAQSPDAEICGLLFGSPSHIAVAEPAANVAPAPEVRFEVDPRALFAAIRDERNGGRAVIGNYHSHPHGPARPSRHDAAMALDRGALWLIVGQDGMRLWRVDEPGIFEPVELALASARGHRQ